MGKKLIKSCMLCILLALIAIMVNIVLPSLTIRVADLVTFAAIVFVIVIVIRMIPVIKQMWQDYCDRTDKATMRAMLGVKMAMDYGIDINAPIERGNPLKLLINDVNWPKKFNQYKYQFGVMPKGEDESEVDIYALMHQEV